MTRVIARREYLLGISAAAIHLVCGGDFAVGDVGGAKEAGQRSRVIAACTKHWAKNQGDCSAFVRAVAQELGFALDGNANRIHEQISGAPWIRIGVGKDAAAIAGVAAGEGKLVIAARPDNPNGHVAVVVDYRNAFDSYPEVDRKKAVAFWGSLHSVGAEYERITRSWVGAALAEVLYAYQRLI